MDEAIKQFLVELSETAGGMVNGNQLSRRARELLAAAPAQAEPPVEMVTLDSARQALLYLDHSNGPGRMAAAIAKLKRA